jgi:hypothetical protein
MDELIKILEEQYLPSEVVKILKELELSSYQEEIVVGYAKDHDVCFNCCGELEWHTWKESRGEYFGFPAFEEMSELICRDCGETY